MKSRNIGRVGYDAFQSIHGWILGTVSLLLTIFFAPSGTITLRTFLLVSVFSLVLIATLIQLIRILYASGKAILPSLITVETLPAPSEKNAIVLLLEPSELFAHESYVAIYRYMHSFERLIGLGYVLTVQQDQKIQVVIQTFVEPNTSETWQTLLDKNAEVMKQIIVKPHLPKSYAEQL